MDFTGSVKSIVQDFETGKFNVTFELDREGAIPVINMLGNMMKEKLNISADKFKKKRSLDANAYFHVLNGKLADRLRISKPRMKNILLYRYGQSEMIDGKEAVMHSNVPASKLLEQEELHCFPIGTDDEGLTIYRIQRGSRTYTTLEMSILIDGLVEECKEHDIETLTPRELAIMYEKWGKKNG